MASFSHDDLVIYLSRDLVGNIAPDELLLFEPLVAAYQRDPDGMQDNGKRDDMLGFGTGEIAVLLTPVVLTIMHSVLPLLIEVVQKTVKEHGSTALAEAIKSLFTHYRSITSSKSLPPPLTADQLRQVRHTAMQKARQRGLEDVQATSLADAIVANLATV